MFAVCVKAAARMQTDKQRIRAEPMPHIPTSHK